jgi:hypothetical protein
MGELFVKIDKHNEGEIKVKRGKNRNNRNKLDLLDFAFICGVSGGGRRWRLLRSAFD